MDINYLFLNIVSLFFLLSDNSLSLFLSLSYLFLFWDTSSPISVSSVSHLSLVPFSLKPHHRIHHDVDLQLWLVVFIVWVCNFGFRLGRCSDGFGFAVLKWIWVRWLWFVPMGLWWVVDGSPWSLWVWFVLGGAVEHMGFKGLFRPSQWLWVVGLL